MLLGAEFWVAVAFFLFLGLVFYAGGHKTLIEKLDARTNKIATQLAEAASLRKEAAELLQTYEKKRSDAEIEAASIVKAAMEEANRLEKEAQKRFDEFIKHKTSQAEQKIKQAEIHAAAEVRAAAVDLAAKAVSHVLISSESGKDFNKNLADIESGFDSGNFRM